MFYHVLPLLFPSFSIFFHLFPSFVVTNHVPPWVVRCRPMSSSCRHPVAPATSSTSDYRCHDLTGIISIYHYFLKITPIDIIFFLYFFCEIVLLDHGYWKQHHLNHHLFWIFQLMIMDYRQLLMITVDKKLHKTYCTRWYSMFWLFWSSFWHDSILVLDTFVVNDDVCRKL